MAANEKLTIQALKDHDKVHPKFKASVGQPTNREVTTENVYLTFSCICISSKFGYQNRRGWSDGAKVLGNLPVPGRPTNLDYSRARAYCACSRCGWGLFGHFYSHLSLLFSFSLSLGEGQI